MIKKLDKVQKERAPASGKTVTAFENGKKCGVQASQMVPARRFNNSQERDAWVAGFKEGVMEFMKRPLK